MEGGDYFRTLFTRGFREKESNRITIKGLKPEILSLLVQLYSISKVRISGFKPQTLTTNFFKVFQSTLIYFQEFTSTFHNYFICYYLIIIPLGSGMLWSKTKGCSFIFHLYVPAQGYELSNTTGPEGVGAAPNPREFWGPQKKGHRAPHTSSE